MCKTKTLAQLLLTCSGMIASLAFCELVEADGIHAVTTIRPVVPDIRRPLPQTRKRLHRPVYRVQKLDLSDPPPHVLELPPPPPMLSPVDRLPVLNRPASPSTAARIPARWPPPVSALSKPNLRAGS